MTPEKPRACPADAGLPDCGTGPAGRLGFVLREARDAWRRRRARAALPTPTDDQPDPTLGNTP